MENIQIIDALADEVSDVKIKKPRKKRVVTEETKEKLRKNASKARQKLSSLVASGRSAEDEETIDLEAEEKKEIATAVETQMKSKYVSELEELKGFLLQELDKREQAKLSRLEAKRKEREEKRKNKPAKQDVLKEQMEEIKRIISERDGRIITDMKKKHTDQLNKLKSQLNF